MKRIRHLAWWWLDYVYAFQQQTASLFRRRTPAAFAEGDQSLPAVILLPGVYETWYFLLPIARRLNALGYRVFSVPELAFNRMSVVRSAEVVAAELGRLASEHHIDKFIVLAHSKGGLIGKQLMLNEPSAELIVGMVAVSTPFSGSSYARYLPSATLQAFSPEDATVMLLNTHPHINAHIVSIYADFDPHIPAKSFLPGAENAELPLAGHFVLLRNRVLGEAVERAVRQMHER